MRRISLLLISFLLVTQVFAQNVNYYSPINTSATGSQLETALSNLITTTHTNIISYSTAYQLLKDANEDAANTNNVILIYSSLSDPKSNSYGGGGTGTASTGWTREHIYAKSLANPNLGTSGPGADAHNLAPCTNSINGARGNKMFEAGSGSYGSVSSTGWYPGDDWRGDVARAVFYMNIRYGSQCDISNVSTLNLLLQWNAIDPVSNLEDQRNDEIYQVQGNRNPFIDNPIFATRIWGGPTAQDRFNSAIADPQVFSLNAGNNSVSFSVTANNASDDVLLAVTTPNGSFGVPSGSYIVGNTISGGGTVLYRGPAANIPDHTGLNSSSVYKYKIWSVDGSNSYSNGLEESISTTGGGVFALYKNSFEGSPDDNWTFTANPTSYNTSGDIWAILNANGTQNSGSDGSSFWGIRDLNNPNGGGNFFHELEFQSIDISGSSGVELSFDYYAEGFESNDELEYELIFDNVNQGATQIFAGSTGGAGSNGWTSVSIAIPDQVNTLAFKLKAKQDGGSDYGGFDNIKLKSEVPAPGLIVSAYSPTAANVEIDENSSGDSILLVYGEGANLIFNSASGLYQVGQSFQGVATVAYFGPETNLDPITQLNEGGDYTFAAYSFNGQSYSDPISQNLILPSAEGTNSGLIFFQGFEGTASDTWSILSGSNSISSASGSSDYPANERILNGSHSLQINDESQTLILEEVNTSSADSLTLTINISSTALTSGNGADGADYIKVYLDLNNSGFSANPDVSLNGNNNAKWGYGSYTAGSSPAQASGLISTGPGQNLTVAPSGGGYLESEGYHKIQIGLNGVSSIGLKIEVLNNSGNEIWNIDDIGLESHSNAVVWNGSNWKNGESPSLTTQNRNLIIYPGEDAELYAEAEVSSLDLKANAHLRISSTASLEVSQLINTAGNISLEADNLGSASYIGPAVRLRKDYYISRAGWQAISFPFSDVSFNDIEFTNGGLIVYAGQSGASSCDTCNLYYYDPEITNGSNIGTGNTTAFGTWIAVDDPNATVSQDHGYYLFLGPPHFGNVPMVISLEGTTRAGTQNINTQDGNGGWNLLPNPFPTALDWSAKSNLGSEGFDQSYWIFNGSIFAVYNNGVGVNGANGYIPSGQAFFVHSASPLIGAGRNQRNFGFQQSMRGRNNRSLHKSISSDIIRIQARIDSTFNNEIALALSPMASESYNSAEDALMAGEKNSSSLYFKMQDGQALSIRQDPLFEGVKQFPIGLGEDLEQRGYLQISEGPSYLYYYLLDDQEELTEINPQKEINLGAINNLKSLVVSTKAIESSDIQEVYWSLKDGQVLLHSFKAWNNVEVYNQQGSLIFKTEHFQDLYPIDLGTNKGVFIIKVSYPTNTEVLKVLR